MLLGLCLGCSLTKNLSEGEYVVFDAEIEGSDKSDEAALANLNQQEPNFRIPLLNVSPGVTIYRIGNSFYDKEKITQKKEDAQEELSQITAQLDTIPGDRKLQKRQEKLQSKIEGYTKKEEYGNGLMRTGNPVTKLDSNLVEASQKNMAGYLQNNSFFDSKTDFTVTTKGKKAFITYQLTENSPYLVDSIFTKSENTEIQKLLKSSADRSNLRVGKRYAQDDIIAERNRVEELLKNNGFFMFSKSYLEYNVYQDTTKKEVQIEQLIRQPTFADKHEIYTIDSINFRINPPSDEFADAQVKGEFNDIDFSFYRDRYSERILASRVLINKGDKYSRSSVIESQRQLSNLDLFRFVNITFDTLGTSLTANIFTQPAQKYQLTNQLGLSVTEQLPGPFFSTSLRNRNFFRAGEILEFNFRAGLEGVASATNQGVYQSKELGVSASIIFPRFLIPFAPSTLEKYGRYNPNTRTQIGYNYTNRPEYTRKGINALLSYNWATTNNRQQFTVNVADINYIRTPKITQEFLDVLDNLANQGNNLIWSFLPSFVSSFSAQSIINFNQYGNWKTRPSSLLKLFVESGGTTLNFLDVPSNSDVENIDYANFQWLKFQADFRRYYPLDQKQTFAYRFNFGIAQPYGVSAGILPYEKYFFAGGGTSIRAWQARRLGPGSYKPQIGTGGRYDYDFEQPGEMIIESMFEYRRNLYGYFDMALFVDVGNSWVIGADLSRPGADFRFDRFYKEFAVGTGLGLRMDFDFLIIRLDLATKAIDPSEPEGDRWVLDNINFKRPFGLKGQTVLNFGIGYPF
ncbi:BamA/TamA family outer membrane protein [Algoriphagus zhangzhouensis]|uniref:Surface antigen n=1 Tax=Algoriphagus zhangzhouensis TaxID=1073327 RepID=A0A1M7ZHP3_9BACT|nr:BamA/TamA family outer membrane protein [Algoriphagus zhangzhouensis]TDY44214.1 surface antigen-like protein [Algoriphagus zhangzhouensis]SHO64394.1 Surface antigen [Algoriphagus zhangzhouensis]